jgi:predicted O-methyltransferase YrrM
MRVTAIESENEWAERVRERCPAADVRFIPGTDTGTLRSEPQLRDRGRHYFDEYVSVINNFEAESFDVIVIDGICRKECARLATQKVKRNGIIVLDDTNWKFLRSAAEAFEGWETVTFSGFKPKSGPFVYSTTFFHSPA